MLVSDFNFDLPEELIAQQPPALRGASRMLVLDRASGSFRDANFADFPRSSTPEICSSSTTAASSQRGSTPAAPCAGNAKSQPAALKSCSPSQPCHKYLVLPI